MTPTLADFHNHCFLPSTDHRNSLPSQFITSVSPQPPILSTISCLCGWTEKRQAPASSLFIHLSVKHSSTKYTTIASPFCPSPFSPTIPPPPPLFNISLLSIRPHCKPVAPSLPSPIPALSPSTSLRQHLSPRPSLSLSYLPYRFLSHTCPITLSAAFLHTLISLSQPSRVSDYLPLALPNSNHTLASSLHTHHPCTVPFFSTLTIHLIFLFSSIAASIFVPQPSSNHRCYFHILSLRPPLLPSHTHPSLRPPLFHPLSLTISVTLTSPLFDHRFSPLIPSLRPSHLPSRPLFRPSSFFSLRPSLSCLHLSDHRFSPLIPSVRLSLSPHIPALRPSLLLSHPFSSTIALKFPPISSLLPSYHTSHPVPSTIVLFLTSL
ncbi:hypothetical protein C8Q80DRAFT_844900 [Daedaleopsis nitida]|nr:hypothetical protein C8Q80DRAFT_844900 [Daedaleopsis nitida]